MGDELLKQANELIKAGDKQQAKRILTELVKQEPNNEGAWFWLSTCLSDRAQIRYCLHRVLEINPDNERVKRTLGLLERPSEPINKQTLPVQSTPSEPSSVVVPIGAEKPQDARPPEVIEQTASPDHGSPMIYCHKCNATNLPTAEKCNQCGANLLPGTSIGERLKGIGVLFLAAILIIPIMYLCSTAANAAGESTGTRMALLVLGPVFALIFIGGGLAVAFRKSKLYEKYQRRAQRHIELNPQQAINDFTQAISSTPEKSRDFKLTLLKQRASVYEKEGMFRQAQQDYQQALALATDLYKISPEKTRLKFLKERANIMEKLSQEDEADREYLNYGYLAEKALPEKKVAMGIEEGFKQGINESKRQEYQNKRKAILEKGKFKALGYCRKCKAVVELDYKMQCVKNAKHGQPKLVRFALPHEVEIVKQQLSTK